MRTIRFEEADPLPDDERIARLLALEDGRIEGHARQYRVGIAGPDGGICRSVVASSLGELVRADLLLKRFGFVEGPAERDFEAVYRRFAV